jgi:hypothetical protein
LEDALERLEVIMNKQPSLKQRIDAALQPDATVMSSELAALIEEIEAEIAKGEEMWRADETSEAALNAILRANGLRTFLPQLQARYERARVTELGGNNNDGRQLFPADRHRAARLVPSN